MKGLNYIIAIFEHFISQKSNVKPCDEDKMTLTEFVEKHSMRLRRVVESCKNEDQLIVAENYIRSGLKHFICSPDSDNANEYVNLLIRPKQLEFENIYNTGKK